MLSVIKTLLVFFLPAVLLPVSHRGPQLIASDEEGADEDVAAAQMVGLEDRYRQMVSDELTDANAVAHLSERGDLALFLGHFDRAVADYREMEKRNPALGPGHWRLGIALYLSGDPAAGAAQFMRYHSYDQIDRENGIWKFLCESKQGSPEEARRRLIDYDRPDRPPLPLLYDFYRGEVARAEVRAALESDTDRSQKSQRLFYGALYLGLHDDVHGRPRDALTMLELAVQQKWPQTAGYGPHYMWHVARLERDRIRRALRKTDAENAKLPDIKTSGVKNDGD